MKSSNRDTGHSNKKKPPARRGSAGRAPTAAASDTPTPTDCTGCPDCSTAASGTLWCCEDGTFVDIPPPTFLAVLTFDPSKPGGLPYWEKPSNLTFGVQAAPAPAPHLPPEG